MCCSQMCEAVVSTCGCKQESKFGPLLDTYLASSDVQAPPGTAFVTAAAADPKESC